MGHHYMVNVQSMVPPANKQTDLGSFAPLPEQDDDFFIPRQDVD